MQSPLPIFILFGLLILVLIIVSAAMAAKRRKELAAWAASRGLSFSQGRNASIEARLGGFDCLRQGSDRYGENIMEGAWGGCRLLACDYHYETQSTDSDGKTETHDHYFSLVALRPPFPIKDLLIREEGLFDKLGAFVGYDDIDFESAEFSRKFYVKASDRRWAYDVLHARAIQFLLDSPRHSIEFRGEWILARRAGTFSAAEFDAAATLVGGLVEMMPDYLVRQQESLGGVR